MSSVCREGRPQCFQRKIQSIQTRFLIRLYGYSTQCLSVHLSWMLAHILFQYSPCRPILLHKAVVTPGIFVPKILSFTHGCLSPRAGICPAAAGRIPAGRHTPGKVHRPCPMYAPAIPAHHEGNGFDLLFLAQSPISFLLYMQLSSSNRLPEEKAGHLYAGCLLSDAKARSRARLTAPGRARCRPVPSARC